jgi:hypothetical protein
MDLELSNVINISVSQAPAGIGAYNTSNLALFTSETPAGSFGTDGYKIYLSPTEVGVDFGSSSAAYKMANAVFSQSPNILAANGYLVVILLNSGEKLDHAITRTQDLVQYFGIISNSDVTAIGQTDMLAAAAVVQPLNKILFVVSNAHADLNSGGKLDLIRTGGFYKTRGLYYGSSTAGDDLLMMASYAGRALSTNFSGSNTTQTMHLKDLTGIQPDPTMTQTYLNLAQTAGADCYVSLQGVAKVFTSGANQFFDQVYNQEWFVGALQVAGFNYLAQSSTKIPQTESGMDGLKGAYRAICEQSITNQYVAAGSWTSPTTFGNQQDFFNNISQRGYYIYSTPVALQNQADRAARKAPLVQIALKEAGAIQSSDVIVNINA